MLTFMPDWVTESLRELHRSWGWILTWEFYSADRRRS